jgi:hypothetical protein
MTGRQHEHDPGDHRPDTSAGQDLPEAPHPAPPAAGYRRPEYVVEIWACPELRARHPDRPLSLHEALNLGHHRKPERDADREAEP